MNTLTWYLNCKKSGKTSLNGFCSGTSYARVVIVSLFMLLISNGCNKNKENLPPVKEAMPKLWKTQFPVEIYYSSPALSLDEKTVYTGTSKWITGSHGPGQIFAAISAATGKERWRLELERNEVRSSPAIASDSSIYFAVEVHDAVTGEFSGDELWHISAKGILLWKYNINPGKMMIDIGLSAPAIGPDGTIYVSGEKLYAINLDGTCRWSVLHSPDGYGEALRNSPVVGDDGRVYFAFHNIPLTALNPDNGSIIWQCNLGVNDHCFASPVIGSDGIIYVATQPGLLYAVSHEGQLLWTFNLASAGFFGTFRSSPAIGRDGSLYFGINNGSPSSAFFALNPDGTLKWKFEPADLPDDVPSTHFDIYSSPALGSDSIVYFGQEFGRVYALKILDGSMVAMAETKSGITWSSPVIDSKGVLYISDISGTLYALQTGNKGLDTLAQWPKYRHDNRNSGRRTTIFFH